MYGKKIGVQVANTSVWNAFIKAAKLDASKIKVVPVQFDPTPLTQGTVDGWFSFITNEPNELRSKGFDVTTFLLADQGYPLVSETYFTKTPHDLVQARRRQGVPDARRSRAGRTTSPTPRSARRSP